MRRARGTAVPHYRVLAGISYPPSRRAEAGEIVDDLPKRSIKWLREQGLIELVDAPKRAVFTKDEPDDEPELQEDDV